MNNFATDFTDFTDKICGIKMRKVFFLTDMLYIILKFKAKETNELYSSLLKHYRSRETSLSIVILNSTLFLLYTRKGTKTQRI